jgi:cyclic beta-1,2-glucan synthetase
VERLPRPGRDPLARGRHARHGGQSCYIRDLGGGPTWSAGHQPIGRPADDYEVVFAADKATFRRRDAGIESVLEVAVSPEHLAEVRRVTLTNHDSGRACWT